jgi:dimethylargininase
MSYGAQSMVAPLKRVLVRAPDEAFGNADPARWHYTAQPDLTAAQAEHAAFVRMLEQAGCEVIVDRQPQPDRADSIFVHDPALVTDRGAIILQMGKALRRGEEDSMATALAAAGVPILGRLSADATAEGGDLLWLDHDTLAVGIGYRTNEAAAAQLQQLLAPLGVTVLSYDLPYDQGPAACLHLMSTVSLVSDDLAVIYRPLMAVRFVQQLERRGVRLIEVPHHEYLRMATNVLAITPDECLMLEGNPITQAALAAAGIEVRTYVGNEMSLKAEGGATCLTRPILRA